MGLALVHGVITGAGGAVTVDSKVGHGACFRVLLPRCDAREEAAPEHGGGRLVLFVDDEEQVCRVARQMLTSLGYEPLTARGGREALEVFRARGAEIDLVVTDLSMPELGGLEVVAAIRAERPKLPIILSTAYPDSLTPERAAAAGITQILLKPYRRSNLARVLSQALVEPRAAAAEDRAS
jgi:CheY-like chemotaxis protein